MTIATDKHCKNSIIIIMIYNIVGLILHVMLFEHLKTECFIDKYILDYLVNILTHSKIF